MMFWKRAAIVLTSAGFLAACGGGSDDPGPPQLTLDATANAEPSASEFMKMAQAAGTTQRMRGDAQLTLIAPSNDAVAEMRAEVDELMRPENREQLQSFVESHLVAKRMLSRDMQAGTQTALSGKELEVDIDSDDDDRKRVSVNKSHFERGDIEAKNGVLFVSKRPVWRPTVFGIVKTQPRFNILEAAVREAGLVDALRGKGPFTVLAPTDAAFAALLAELNLSAAQLLADKPLLTQVLSYHVLPAKLSQRRIDDGATPATLQGQAVTFSVVGKGKAATITITDAQGRQAKVVETNLLAGNGVVHAIDKVILPQTKNVVQIAQGNPDFSLLVEAVVAAGLAETLSGAGPFTVFAPTNAAFAALLGELNLSKEQLFANTSLLGAVLTYHVVPGRVLAEDIKEGAKPKTVQGQVFTLGLSGGPTIADARGRTANIVATNVQASNGVIHVIDKVILPQTKNIVEVALGVPDFSILVEAVLAAELQGVLSGTGPFTVFAPTNAAFASLLGELGLSKEQLLANKPLLTAVLTYHVLPAKVLAQDVSDGAKPATVQGQMLSFDKSRKALEIEDARGREANVIATDVQASNGVIHVIDKVLLPAL